MKGSVFFPLSPWWLFYNLQSTLTSLFHLTNVAAQRQWYYYLQCTLEKLKLEFSTSTSLTVNLWTISIQLHVLQVSKNIHKNNAVFIV